MLKNTNDLTVVTVVENDSGLINLMVKSVRKFTDPEPYIIICNNGRNGNLLDEYKDDARVTIIDHNPTMRGGSNRHGESLNRVFKEITTSKAAIVESDCIITAKNWDRYDYTKYDIMASLKGVHQGFTYYYAALMVFNVNEMHGIDLRPGNDNTRANRSYQPHEDVVWRISEKINPQRVKSIQCVDCKTGDGQFLDDTFQCEEYWIDGSMVAVHFGRGSNIPGKANRHGFDSHKAQLARFRGAVEQLILE